MEMELVTVEIKVEKNAKEIIDAAFGIVQHFIDGKPLIELTGKLPEVMAAVDDAAKALAAAKSDNRDEIAGYLIHKGLGMFPAKEDEPADEQPVDSGEQPDA